MENGKEGGRIEGLQERRRNGMRKINWKKVRNLQVVMCRLKLRKEGNLLKFGNIW